jgi:NhaD family Na+/H+ antiporter
MLITLSLIFILGYLAIAFEHPLKVNKAASALLTGVLCWSAYVFFAPDRDIVSEQLMHHLGDVASILFFLLGAMTIVELVDAHDGFWVVTSRIQTTQKSKLLWIIGFISFFLSAILDNLTTTIVMISLIRKLIPSREDRLLFAGLIVIAANAGGAWSPIGDVTTTMLWIGKQITAIQIIKGLFLPSLVCLLVPLLVLSRQMKGHFSWKDTPQQDTHPISSTPKERNIIFATGILGLVSVPIFKSLTHLPPFMGILLALGVIWLVSEYLHAEKDELDREPLSVVYALRKIDTPSILFFLGILIAIHALESTGLLHATAEGMAQAIGNETVIGIVIGLLSAVVDNVPLVAAAQGMYPLTQYPTDAYFWELLAYCAGTGGSILVIGSAAGVAAMGMEKIDFFWYIRKISLLAALGYFAGVAVYIVC